MWNGDRPPHPGPPQHYPPHQNFPPPQQFPPPQPLGFQQQRPDFRPPSSGGGPRWPWFVGGLTALLVLGLVAFLLLRPGLIPLGPLTPPGIAADGGDGVGDPYFPEAGGGGYDARGYRIEVSWDEAAERLDGVTTMTAVATRILGRFHLDLALPVQEVRLDGAVVQHQQQGTDLSLTAAKNLQQGQEFRVEVRYGGNPREAGKRTRGTVWQQDRELLFADEPFGAPLWFPSNDHPSDPATMEVIARVPQDLQAISVGALVSRDEANEPDHDTWHWRSTQPMATYLNFLAIGPFTVIEGQSDGRPHVYAISKQLNGPLAAGCEAALRRTPETVRRLEEIWGPYPFSELGGVATSTRVTWGALENQTRPVYQAEALARDPDRLLTHELAHMWFGNNVTVRGWNDIYMNEAYASFSEWAVAERHGGTPARDKLRSAYRSAPDRVWQVPIGNPGPNELFGAVYLRGPMSLQALRNVLGDEQFFALGREWATEPGSRGVADWQQRAQRRTRTDLGPFWQAWLIAREKPADTPANGLG
ncbi:peptidase [Enemella dayhoffiae]|uniref:Aminopeptidase N n=1 Tax=Enemella dayhoffiae TaxID=2016507 RepID=A0A255GVH2_9ACTN|nr:M1 family metallopeptidase [Enemella dayhoffiae]OYO17224.1 peptidase [Enemella dayhoffiae]